VWVHEGGISTPLIVHWPRGITAGGQLRHTPGHVIDFVPTLLDLAGAEPLDTWNGVQAPPLPGKSFVRTLAADSLFEREFLFFQHEGNRALREGDWKLVSARENPNAWELYDLSHDRCESRNLAVQQPERLQQMATRWTHLEAEFRRQAGE
jgi:arylsulfatase